MFHNTFVLTRIFNEQEQEQLQKMKYINDLKESVKHLERVLATYPFRRGVRAKLINTKREIEQLKSDNHEL